MWTQGTGLQCGNSPPTVFTLQLVFLHLILCAQSFHVVVKLD